MLDLELEDLVVVAEYCGGGFGSKITAHPSMAMTALLSQKVGRPVMLRVTRYEENYIGRARPGFQAHARLGFRNDGRMTGLDLFIVQDQGPYGRSGDVFTAATVASLTYQPLNMRFQGVSVFTNTPPRSAQRAPGGAQIIGMLEPLVDKAARELGMDRVEIRKINAPDNDGWVGPSQASLTSAYPREALDMAAEIFGWEEKQALSGRREGTKATGLGIGVSPFVAGSSGFDGLVVIRPDGKLYVHQGIGNLGTHSIADTARAAADALGLAWDDVVVVWGDSARHQPWSSVQAGSQTTHAHTRANLAAGEQARRKLQEIAATDLGGSPEQYEVSDGRVYRRGSPGRGLSLAQAAERAIELGGVYDGHELDEDLHAMTRASATGLAGQGLVAAAKDTYPHDGSTFSWVVGFAQVEIDVETGHLEVQEYTAVTDCGRVLHPRSLGAQVFGGSIQGMGIAMTQKWVFDPKWGVPFAKRLYTARPPGILDVPLNPRWAAVGIPDPQSPIGAKGIGEPPVGAGSAAIAGAVADALGGECLCRTPLTADVILAAIEGTEKPYRPLETHV
jgi:CO/xanthine dehydrogenase Mo-binding subunit